MNENASIPRTMSENLNWNQQNSSNIVLDANIQHDSSTTPRTEPPKSHWAPHQLDDSLNPILQSNINSKNNSSSDLVISKQVSWNIISDNNPPTPTPDSAAPANLSPSPSAILPIPIKSSSSKSNLKRIEQSNSADSNQNNNNTSNDEEKDMFEIEKQLKSLHHTINASKQKEHNAFILTKPLFLRFLSCSLPTQPSKWTMDQILNSSKTCDLFFQRKGNEFEGEILSDDVLRGVKSTLDGKYMPKSCHLKLWSHVGIIVTLTSTQITPKPSPRGGNNGGGVAQGSNASSSTTNTAAAGGAATSQKQQPQQRRQSQRGGGGSIPMPPLSLIAEEEPKQSRRTSFLSRVVPQKEIKTKYLLIANERGISLRNFHEILTTCDFILRGSLPTGRYVAAYRPIRVTKLGIPQYCHMTEYLEELGRLALSAGGLLLWRDLFTIYQYLLNSKSNPNSNLNVNSNPIELPSLPYFMTDASITTFNFLKTFFARLASVSYRPSNESIAEAIRCFHLIATSHLSDADYDEMERKSKSVSGKTLLRGKSQYETISIASLREGLRGILKIPVTADKKGAAIEEVGAGGGSGSNGPNNNNNGNNGNSQMKKETVIDVDSNHQLVRLLNAFEADLSNDGMISLDEFLSLFLSLPSPTIPIEFEFPSVAMAELVASIFNAFGIFPDDYLNACIGQSFHPQSFSSTHTSTHGALLRANSNEINNSTKMSRRSHKVNSILPISEDYKGPTATAKGYTQMSTFNHTPLAKRDLKKKFALWYEKDILMTSS